MQILNIETEFEVFECKFKQDSKHLNPNSQRHSKHSNANLNPKSNYSKGTRRIRKGFEAFESKLEPFERDSKHPNQNPNHSKGF